VEADGSVPGRPTLRRILIRFLGIVVLGLLFSALIPPLQSPDEADHLKRAALLAQGVILLQTPDAQTSSGGLIDSGLEQYLTSFDKLRFRSAIKVNAPMLDAARQIEWSGQQVFSTTPGTGYYFPAIYLPQALALWTGQRLHLSVDQSYHLARLLCILLIAAVVVYAFELFAPSVLVVALLALPMTVFQAATASIDGLTIALTLFVLSVTMRTAQTRQLSAGLLGASVLCIFVIVTCRIHLLPLLLLPLYFFVVTRQRRALLSALGLFVATGSWLLTAIRHTVDRRAPATEGPAQMAAYYLHHPAQLWGALSGTLGDDYTVSFYQHSFIGILGWLDTEFTDATYTLLGTVLLLIALLSVALPRNRERLWLAAGLVSSALISCLSVLFLLLITWTPTGSTIIRGVQGRYFLLPALIVAYALFDPTVSRKPLYRRLGLGLVVLLGVLTLILTPGLLVDRYYLAITGPR
jgi:uncharacterized membrane protein